jgi:hypothetical protein
MALDKESVLVEWLSIRKTRLLFARCGYPTTYAICIRYIFVIFPSRKGISRVRNPIAMSARPNGMPQAADVPISSDSEARN